MEPNRRHTREYSRFRPAAKGATPWRTLRPPLRVRRRSGHASATGGTPGRRRYPTPPPRSERHGARRRGRWRRAPGTANGSRPPIGLIRSSCSRSRLPLGCPSWCRSATGGCWCRRSRSSAARPTRWRPTWPAAPRTGLAGAALWRCASVQLRWVRRARPAAGVQHQRLRRDAAGPVRVGREAAGGQLRRGRPGSRLRRQTAAVDQSGRDAFVPGGDQGVRRDVQPRALVRPHRRGRDRRAGGSAGDPKAAEAVRAQPGQGAVEGQPEGVREAHDDRRRRAQDRERPAADRPDRRGGVRRRTGRARGVRTGSHPLLPAHPERRPPAAARALSLRPLGAQGCRRGQRRRACLDRADARARRERSAVPAAQGGAAIGARAVPGQELVQQPRPAGRRGPAADAGRQRHHARLDPDDGFRRRRAGISTCASSGTARARLWSR